MKKEASVVMLPTPIKHGSHQKGIIHKYCDELSLTEIMMVTKDAEGCVSTPHHLYITDDSEIKEGDWVIETANDNAIEQFANYSLNQKSMGCKKIIATTDPELHYKGDFNEKLGRKTFADVAQIPQSFIESYCKNPVDKVMIEYTLPDKIKNALIVGNISRAIDSDYILKVDSNNEIIIHPIEDKMYTREEVEAIAAKFLLLGFGKSAEGRNAEILCESRWLEEMFPEHFESIEIFTKDNL